jgi:putative FmdB family regulatory protein
MPIYEYQCRACQHEFETIQKISEPVLTQCPVCGKDQLQKKISAVAFRLKGGGWYETDFKSGDKRNVAGSDEGGGSKSDGAEATKSDAKDGAAAKSDTSSSESAAKPAKDGAGKESSNAPKAAKSAESSKKSESKPTSKAKPAGD